MIIYLQSLYTDNPSLPGNGESLPLFFWENLSCNVQLNTQHLYIHLVPRDGLQHQVLSPLDIQAEIVNGGIAQGQQQAVDREALEVALL